MTVPRSPWPRTQWVGRPIFVVAMLLGFGSGLSVLVVGNDRPTEPQQVDQADLDEPQSSDSDGDTSESRPAGEASDSASSKPAEEADSQADRMPESEADDEANDEANDEASGPAVEAPEPIDEMVVTRALSEIFASEPMSVGRIELTFAEGRGPIIYPDQVISLESTDDRAHYAAMDVEYDQTNERTPFQATRLECTFLVRDKEPIELRLKTRKADLFHGHLDHFIQASHEARTLKTRWWNAFSAVPEETQKDARRLKEDLLDLLARRHRMSWSPRRNSSSNQLKTLEGQFERAVGMLFGFESVKLAMQDEVTLTSMSGQQKANQRLPAKPRMRSVNIPDFREGWIEPIAMRAPEECFYLRTQTLENYRAFRSFLTGWGGSLDDVVASGTIDRQTRRKIEFQLGLQISDRTINKLDQVITDVALIGFDPLFDDGAAVGVVFEARGDGVSLMQEIKSLRASMLHVHEDVDEERLSINQRSVSLLSSDDQRVRSFYAIDGKYHLVTNSKRLVQRFFDTARGIRSLGRLREFRYAKSKAGEKAEAQAFLYLSDPFFQNLVSPHYRIEMTRRARARRELSQLHLARLVAKAEGVDADSIDELVLAGYVSPRFGKRPDGSQPLYDKGRYRDSLRGIPGAFVPVADIVIDRATSGEVNAYRRFLAEYNREWRRVDPVTVLFSQQRDFVQRKQSRVTLEIMITPYARQRYALLNTHLADASEFQLSSTEDDLLHAQAAVRMRPGSRSHLLSIGLRDEDVQYKIENGAIRLLDEKEGATFASRNVYAAISPPGTEMLRTLGSVLLHGKPASRSPVRPPPRSTFSLFGLMPLPGGSPSGGHPIMLFARALSLTSPEMWSAAKYASMIESRGDLTLVSMSEHIRIMALKEIAMQRSEDPHEIRLSMRTLKGTQVEPYIQAYTYLQARHRSAGNSRLLNQFSDWLKLPSKESRVAMEGILGGSLVCPLGGNFEFRESEGRGRWEGTAWESSSAYTIDDAPETWQFPFLHWLRGLDVRFDLDESTLHAQVDLIVHSDRDPIEGWDRENEERVVSARASGENAEDDEKSDAAQTPAESTDDWILGVHVKKRGAHAVVLAVHKNSPAEVAQIKPGDLIKRVDGKVPESIAKLDQAMKDAHRNGVVQIQIDRKGTQLQLRIPLKR